MELKPKDISLLLLLWLLVVTLIGALPFLLKASYIAYGTANLVRLLMLKISLLQFVMLTPVYFLLGVLKNTEKFPLFLFLRCFYVNLQLSKSVELKKQFHEHF